MRTRSQSADFGYFGWSDVHNLYGFPHRLRPRLEAEIAGVISGFREITDVVSPGYFGALKAGSVLPVNPMNADKHFVSGTAGEFRFSKLDYGVVIPGSENQGFGGHLSPYFLGVHLPHLQAGNYDPLETAEVIASVAAKAKAAAFDVATFGLEINKTISLITGFRKRVADLIYQMFTIVKRRLKSKKRKAPPKDWFKVDIFKLLSQIWLEIRYGWRILFYDIESIKKALQVLSDVASPLDRYSDSFNITSESSSTLVSQCGAIPRWAGTFRCEHTLKTTRKVRVAGGYETRTRFENALQFDPLVTAWELIPFSFVIDMFVNVGDLLQSFSPIVERKNVYGSIVQSVVQERKAVTTIGVMPQDNSRYTTAWQTQTPSIGVEVRETRVRVPTEIGGQFAQSFNLSVPQAIDIFALIHSLWGDIIFKNNRSLA
jgi:hypothetical protein